MYIIYIYMISYIAKSLKCRNFMVKKWNFDSIIINNEKVVISVFLLSK